MSNIEKAIGELSDVVEHLVTTHVKWNMDLDKDTARAKVAAARVHAVQEAVEELVTDVKEGVSEVGQDLKAVAAAATGSPVTPNA